MPTAAAHFPDAFVRLLPVLTEPIKLFPDARPQFIPDRHHMFVVQIHCVEELTVDVQL